MAEARHLPTFRANEERLAVLADVCRELNERFAGRAEVEREVDARPPSWSVTVGDDRRRFASFGVIDANYFWTFDRGTSCHYARNKDVMRRLLVREIAAELTRTGKPA